MDGRTLLLIVAGSAVVVAVVMTALALSSRLAGTIDPTGDVPARPWWGSPVVWLLVGAIFVALGLFVFPKLFGFAFLFLPFVWIGRFGRRRSWGDRDVSSHRRDDAAPHRPGDPG